MKLNIPTYEKMVQEHIYSWRGGEALYTLDWSTIPPRRYKRNAPWVVYENGLVEYQSHCRRDPDGRAAFEKRTDGSAEIVRAVEAPKLYTPDGQPLVKAHTYPVASSSWRRGMFTADTILIDYEHNTVLPLGGNGFYLPYRTARPLPKDAAEFHVYPVNHKTHKLFRERSAYVNDRARAIRALEDVNGGESVLFSPRPLNALRADFVAGNFADWTASEYVSCHGYLTDRWVYEFVEMQTFPELRVRAWL